jgi:hypothetical protein
MERLEQEIAAIPGVVMVAAVQRRPLDGSGGGSFVSSPNGPPATGGVWLNNPAARTSIVRGAPGFIEVLGIPLLSGRTLEVRDACDFPFFAPASEAAPGAPLCPVVVDDRFAEVFFPGEVPIGQHFEIPNITPAFDYQIVGVVANARLGVLREEAPPTMYSLAPAGFSIDHLAIRAEIGSGALATAVQQAVERVDAGVPLAEFHTQSGLIARLLRTELLLALVSGGFSLAALVLAAVGLGGLLAYSVARRTNEIGIRMALGASRGEVRRMVLGDSLSMVGLGLLIGIPAAWSVGRYLESQLFGLEPIDPMATSLALAALSTIALIAAMIGFTG